MESYTKKSLLLDVLNEVCGQLNIKVSSLIFLNYEFTNEQIRDLLSIPNFEGLIDTHRRSLRTFPRINQYQTRFG